MATPRGPLLAACALVGVVALAAAGCTAGPPATSGTGSLPGSSARASSPPRSPTLPSGSPTPASGSGAAAWTTYGHDAGRTGVGPGGPPAGPVRRLWRSPALDGAVYAQPLVAGGRVVVATENDSIYALSATTGRVLWRAHVGAPVPGASLPCGNIDPSGITGTPVIDRATGLVYAVANVVPHRHELVAVSLRTGALRFRRAIDPAGSDPALEQQRGALTLLGGRVYAVFGGLFGDCGDYHGWVVSAPADGRGALVSYRVPAGAKGGIWAPGGATVGPGGTLYAATGNSVSTARFDLGDAVIRLSADLALRGFFAPPNWAQLNGSDLDLGSVSPTLLPGGLLFQVGKQGVGYLVDAARPGGIGGELFAGRVCSAAFGATAHEGRLVYVPCTDGLVALRIGSGPSFREAWRSASFVAGPPVLSRGAVWCLDTATGTLHEFAAGDGRPLAEAAVGPVAHFAAPSVAGGRVFVGALDGVLAFGAR